MGSSRTGRNSGFRIVPDVVGLFVADALQLAVRSELLLQPADPEIPLAAWLSPLGWRVAWQLPVAGSRRNRNEVILAGYGPDDGLAGVREPRSPLPSSPLTESAVFPDHDLPEELDQR